MGPREKLLLFTAAGLVVGTTAYALLSDPPPKKRAKKGAEPSPPGPNQPPGARDVPRVPAEKLAHQTDTTEDALLYVGEFLAAKAIRDGRPVVYTVSSEIPDEDASSWKAFLVNFRLISGQWPVHQAEVTSFAWPFDTILVGAIYQQPNGIWTATLPTPDLIYEVADGDSAMKAASRMAISLERFMAGAEEPAAFSELTPEQARLIREGSGVNEAVEKTT